MNFYLLYLYKKIELLLFITSLYYNYKYEY